MRIRQFAAAFGIAFLMAAPAADAQMQRMSAPEPESPNIVNLPETQASGQITIPVDKSQLVHVDRMFGEISVGNKDVADVVPLTKNLIYVLGKKRGATNVTISDDRGNVIAVVDVLVTYDVDSLRQGLTALIPDENVTIRPAADSLVLSGQVSSADRLRQILAYADRYAPGNVTNLMTLAATQQVLLQVRFAEVQRTAATQLGANFNVTYNGTTGVFDLATGTGLAKDAFGAVATDFAAGRWDITAELDALEKKGLVRTLAQPNLVALSGDTASFLAGGEIPIPSVQTQSSTALSTQPLVTVQYKDFGVSLSFTPTVVGKEQINLEIKSEVSAIDPSLALEINGTTIPGLKVRRAGTTIELKDGQSFSIAGLLQDDFADNANGMPVLQHLPVLGALFRSTNFQHQQTELVVLITAHLVDPAVAKNFVSPADAVVLPTPLHLFGNGETEGKPANGNDTTHGYVLP
jgi:pilus assembly protein CpaC